MATQNITYDGTTIPNAVGPCASNTFDTVANELLLVCTKFVLGTPGFSSDYYEWGATISNNLPVPGEYKGETILNVTATVTNSSNNPIATTWNGTSIILAWETPTLEFGSICDYTIQTTTKTYTLAQSCYLFTSMSFLGGGFADVCDTVPIDIVVT